MATLLKIHTSGRFMYAKSVLLALIAARVWMQLEKHFRLSELSQAAYTIIALFAILVIVVAFVRSKLQTFEISDDGITSRIGIISVKTQFVPYSKIDSVNVSRTLSDRIFGLGTLRIDTLASIGAEILVEEIPSSDLERALQAIQSRIHSGGGGHEGIPPYRR